MEPLAKHDRPDEISKLESKVLLALSRLQKGRYPSRRGRSGGVASKQVANYLANHYCYLDGDIESQVMTALLSCVKTGLVCALSDGKFRLLSPNSKNMATNCITRTSHGPECTCLNLINSIRKNSHKTCCYNNVDGSEFVMSCRAPRGRTRQPKSRRSPTKKPRTRPKLKVKRQTKKRARRAPTKCIQKEEKDLKKRKKTDTSVLVIKSSKKNIPKCEYCKEKHPPPDDPTTKLCLKCHPPGTRFGVPYDKFSPREEVMKI